MMANARQLRDKPALGRPVALVFVCCVAVGCAVQPAGLENTGGGQPSDRGGVRTVGDTNGPVTIGGTDSVAGSDAGSNGTVVGGDETDSEALAPVEVQLPLGGAGGLTLVTIAGISRFEQTTAVLDSDGAADFTSGDLSLVRSALDFLPLDGADGGSAVALQVVPGFCAIDPLEITVWIDTADGAVCSVIGPTGNAHGPFTVELGPACFPVAVTPTTVPLTEDAVDLVNTGAFTVCIQAASPVDGLLTIRSLTLTLVPGMPAG